jgi:hypothetical protein
LFRAYPVCGDGQNKPLVKRTQPLAQWWQTNSGSGMRVLLIHQNFPGQFKHLGPALVARGDHVVALTPKVKERT